MGLIFVADRRETFGHPPNNSSYTVGLAFFTLPIVLKVSLLYLTPRLSHFDQIENQSVASENAAELLSELL